MTDIYAGRRNYDQIISVDSYLKLKGLKQLAEEHQKQLDYIVKAVASVINEQTDERGYADWSNEIIWGLTNESVDNALGRIKIEVDWPQGVPDGN